MWTGGWGAVDRIPQFGAGGFVVASEAASAGCGRAVCGGGSAGLVEGAPVV